MVIAVLLLLVALGIGAVALVISWEIAAAIIIPVFAFGSNWWLRAERGYSLSAAADFALALATFDLTAATAHRTFEKTVLDPAFRDNFVTMFVVLFALSFISWFAFFLPFEHKMLSGYDHSHRLYAGGTPTGKMVVAWTVLGSMIFIHIYPFIGR